MQALSVGSRIEMEIRLTKRPLIVVLKEGRPTVSVPASDRYST
jgi:hypothetical protein